MKPSWLVLLAVAVATGFTAFLLGAARAYEATTAREVQYRYLDEALERIETEVLPTRWLPPVRDLARPVDTGDRAAVETRLSEAWSAFAGAQSSGETAFLSDWFHDTALARASRAAETAHRDGTRMAVLRQTLRPDFYHLDGSLLQLEAENLTVRFAEGPDGLAHYDLVRDRARSTLLRRSTGWHVVSQERLDTRPAETAAAARLGTLPLAGVNYYPAATPWRLFWPNYDPATTAADLDLIKWLGGNALRIFLPEADFAPGPARAANLAALADLLAQAEARGLHVVPTLFDLRDSYALARWGNDLEYLDAVLPVLGASAAVALIDVKNEPDLDFATHGKALVLAWLRTMAAGIRAALPDRPLTVGWAAADPAGELLAQLDVISYHDYADPEGTRARLAAVRALAGDKPVLVTEIGATAWTLAMGRPSSPAAQAAALERRLDALAAADGVFVWTLHDFPDPDPTAIGASPWVQGLQAHFGLHDHSGAPRPSAGVIRDAFRTILKGDRP